MKPSLTVGLVPRIATRLIPTHKIENVSLLAAKEKKPPTLNMRGRLFNILGV
ncbi:MAG: hypothetical protein QOH71_2672 [Blastocatellia bacterium]|jgi:hypothetical protein|nr:hypothetical protein [Blastocatellia bacterium]